MSEPKFTPGPWLFSSYKSGNSVIVIDGKEFDVATVNYPNRDANAHLIAAAPELYNFVEEYLEAWENGMAGDSYLFYLAQAVRDKARGEA